MILFDDELRASPALVLDRVSDWAGLPRANASAIPGGAPAALAAIVGALYPAFGRTGWALDAAYAPLEPALRARLDAFFEPHSRALFEYLGDEVPAARRPAWAPVE